MWNASVEKNKNESGWKLLFGENAAIQSRSPKLAIFALNEEPDNENLHFDKTLFFSKIHLFF